MPDSHSREYYKSLAPLEHIFSVSEEVSKGKRNRLADYNLERETLIRKQKVSLKYSASLVIRNLNYPSSSDDCSISY